MWTGTDYTSNEPVEKKVTVNFYDTESATSFYESVVVSAFLICYNGPE